jgi:hypothetical protein
MRARWRLLFWVSLASLIGLSWVASAFGASTLGLLSFPVLCMIAGSIVAFVAMVASYDQRWPAWLVLACWIPHAMDTLRAFGFLRFFIERAGVGSVLFFGGGAATLAVALWIGLSEPVKPPEPDPIARAELR